MKRIFAAFIILAITAPAMAWDNPNKSAASFISVPKERNSIVTLEARRVKSINGNMMIYDLGRETVTVKADSFAARRFIKDVQSGRVSARETVILEPARKSAFNTQFNAVRSPSH